MELSHAEPQLTRLSYFSVVYSLRHYSQKVLLALQINHRLIRNSAWENERHKLYVLLNIKTRLFPVTEEFLQCCKIMHFSERAYLFLSIAFYLQGGITFYGSESVELFFYLHTAFRCRQHNKNVYDNITAEVVN